MKVEIIKEVPFKESTMKLTGIKEECEKKLNLLRRDFGEDNVIVVFSHDYSNISLNRYECLVNVKID